MRDWSCARTFVQRSCLQITKNASHVLGMRRSYSISHVSRPTSTLCLASHIEPPFAKGAARETRVVRTQRVAAQHDRQEFGGERGGFAVC